MALLLNIDTAFETACISLSRGGKIIAQKKSHQQKDHASFLQPAIREILETVGLQLGDVDAVAVANGPGSYTGLRVGLSSAKAICYALHKPLILLNTLDILAHALKSAAAQTEPDILFCPLVDARRMEVYTAVYDIHLEIIKAPAAIILDEHFLEEELEIYRIIAGGSGSFKLRSLLKNPNLAYVDALPGMEQMIMLAHKAFASKNFADIAYSEPVYLKPVYIRRP